MRARAPEMHGKEGDEEMNANIETERWYGGVRGETLASAAKRYGVTKEVIKRNLDRQVLFRAADPRTKVLMVCGALPEGAEGMARQAEKSEGTGFWTVIYYIIACPTNAVMPNLMWTAFWMTVILLFAFNVDPLGGFVIALAVATGKFIYAVKWDLDHPRKIVPIEYVPYECGGGDGFFDEVSTRRRSDIQFLMGTGPFAE